MTSRRSSASRSSASRAAAGGKSSRAPKARSDGKVDCSCPQCGTRYRVLEEQVSLLIECGECHRSFKPMTTVGKRAKGQDHTKVYVGFGVGALVIVGLFALSGGGGGKDPAPPPTPTVAKAPVESLGSNPRSDQLVKWGQAIASGNTLVLQRHSDPLALAKLFGVEAGPEADAKTIAALQAHDATRYFRELDCVSAALADQASLTGSTGKAVVYLTPRSGTDDYLTNTRGEFEVTFRIDGDQVRVTGLTELRAPARNPKKPDPRNRTFAANKDIAAPKEQTITDSAGTRTVKESPPSAVPHWDKATPAQQKLADETVAKILRSADPESPGGLFAGATLKIQELDDRKAVVPRVLNAMYELYSDVNANNLKLSQLNRAMVTFTGFAVNYQVESTGDPAKDKAARESCVRQWFAFWWRYSSGDLSNFLDLSEDLDTPTEPKKGK